MKNPSRSSVQVNNGQIILQNRIVKNASILVENGKIARIGRFPKMHGVRSVNAKGLFVSPGFIDSHIHGDPATILSYEIKHGTTAIVPAISCGSFEMIEKAASSIARFKEKSDLGPLVMGLRIEGPYISKEKAGAQDKRYIKPPSAAGLRRIIKMCRGLLKIMTLAPELEGADELVGILRKHKIIASMGHTNAHYKDAVRGIRHGITHATHLFNGMRGLRGDGAGAALACLTDERVMVEIIFDLLHVREPLLRRGLTMKNRDNVILITDSVRGQSGWLKIKGGLYRLKNDTIAGSGLTMMGAVENAVRRCGIKLKDAVMCATINPARLLKVDAFKGSISRGKDADIVIFDKYFDVKMTMSRGKILYRKRGF